MTLHRPFRVAILFSGDDTPGMNPYLRHFVRLGLNRHGIEVLGIKDGYSGLVNLARRVESGQSTVATCLKDIDTHKGLSGVDRADQSLVLLDHRSVSGLLSRGGIMLGASRCPDFLDPEVRRQAAGLLEDLGVRRAVVVLRRRRLARRGKRSWANESSLRVVGIPASIDNGMPMTEMALGVDTAVNTLAWAVAHLAGTAVNHHRIMVFEVMGKKSGDLTRMAALASGAEIVVTPERGPLTAAKILSIAQRLERGMLLGRRHSIVLVAEGVALDPLLTEHGERTPTIRLASELEAYFRREESRFPDLEARACVLGPLVCGGSPSVADRILAARFAEAAWLVISSRRERSGVLGLRHGSILLQDFHGWHDPERIEAAERLYRLQKDVSRV